MIISIGGTPGSGKSTVGKILAKHFNLKRYYIGQIMRDIAKEKGMTIREYLESGEDDPSVDREVDEYQKKLGETEDNFLIEGRTSFQMIPKSIKIFIYTDLDTGAERIYKDLKENSKDRNEGKFKNVEEVKCETEKRITTDKKRYKKYYNVDVFDKKNYDISIDSSSIDADKVTDNIIKEIQKFNKE